MISLRDPEPGFHKLAQRGHGGKLSGTDRRALITKQLGSFS
jgi:hypothetical protein